jgi:hypothetical protein
MLGLFLTSTPHLGRLFHRKRLAPDRTWATTSVGSGVGGPGREWRPRIVLDLELDLLRRPVTARPPDQLQRQVDPRRHTARRRELAVDDVPLAGYFDAEPRERLARQPVGGCPAPLSTPACARSRAPVQTEQTQSAVLTQPLMYSNRIACFIRES